MFIVKRSSRNRKINSFVIKWHRLHGLFKFYFATVKLRINVHIFVIHMFSSYWTTCIAMFLSLFVSSAWCYGERFFFHFDARDSEAVIHTFITQWKQRYFFRILNWSELNYRLCLVLWRTPFQKKKNHNKKWNHA